MEEKLMNTGDVAEFLGRSEGAIRNLVLRRVIPYRKVAGRLVFLKSEIESWIAKSPGMRLKDIDTSLNMIS